MALQYDIYVGIRGGGNLTGNYIARVISSYADVKMGGIFDSTGITDFNEYNRQLELQKRLNENYPILAQGNGYLIFDLYHPKP
jgi:hypothetical protein